MEEVAVIIPLQMEILRLSDLSKVFHIPWPGQTGEFCEFSLTFIFADDHEDPHDQDHKFMFPRHFTI